MSDASAGRQHRRQGIYRFGLRKERMGIVFKVMDGSEDQWPLIVDRILK
ncbi:hypothetical protein [Paenibacillus popilliae]|nr:hypothetical protein [Paenibacillus popilliae]